MTTYAINAANGASTKYLDYGFESFCRGHDGKYYGIRDDGIYLLEGLCQAQADFGDLDFGTSAQKHITSAYSGSKSDDLLTLSITSNGETYDYPARSYSEDIKVHRFNVGKGLRSNYFGVKVSNGDGGDFTIDTVELAAVETTRRV